MAYLDRVQQKLKGATPEQARFFAWLCAVRALPFLGAEGHLDSWPENERQDHLYSVLHASDCAADRITTAAHSTVDNALDTALATISVNVVNTLPVFYAAYGADIGATAVATTICANAYNVKLRFERLLLDDLQLVKNGIFESFNHDLSVYISQGHGNIWENFMTMLRNAGCGYWANLYTDIFNSGFMIDKEELTRRMSVPDEITEQGAVAAADYLVNTRNQGAVYIQRETRLIILGSAGAGKTTLAKRLNGELDYPAIADSTHGVDTRVELDCNGIKTHIWDFDGQVIYHALHRCFMSANCVYILVVNTRTENNRDINRIKYWLDTIRVYSDNRAKVFIVLNESDNCDQNLGDYNSFKDGEYASLIQEIYSFNIGKDIASVNTFKKELTAYIEAIGHQAYGKNDSLAIGEIRTLFDKNRSILETSEMEAILWRNGIQTGPDQRRAKELFNSLGVALSYDFMDDYVLDPYWISHGVYKVIDHLQRSKSLFIDYNDFDSVFVDEHDTYPKDKYEYILKLMEHYRIGFRNKDGLRGLIIPCAASQFKPKDIIISAEPDTIMTQVERDDLQEFPADFFYKFICANEVDIKKNGETWAMWQTGMVLAEEHASAFVELKENRRIEITVWGQGKEEYRKKLESLIDSLLKEYRFTSYREERKKGGKLVSFITLVFESVAKGIAKAFIEAASGGSVKP